MHWLERAKVHLALRRDRKRLQELKEERIKASLQSLCLEIKNSLAEVGMHQIWGDGYAHVPSVVEREFYKRRAEEDLPDYLIQRKRRVQTAFEALTPHPEVCTTYVFLLLPDSSLVVHVVVEAQNVPGIYPGWMFFV